MACNLTGRDLYNARETCTHSTTGDHPEATATHAAVHIRDAFFTSAKEDMFYPVSVCLSVTRITREIVEEFDEIFLEGCGM